MSSLNFKKIFVPVDFSDTALRAVEHASLLARKNDAVITLVHVMESVSVETVRLAHPVNNFNIPDEQNYHRRLSHAQLEERMEDQVRMELKKLESKLIKDGANVAGSIIEKGNIHKKIASVVKKHKADIIIMGTHGSSGFREFMVGSNTYRVVNDVHTPVLSVREEFDRPGFKTILLPFIDAPHMREHVDYAIRLAKIYNATIDVLGIDTEKNLAHFQKVRQEAEQIKHIAAKFGVNCNIDVYPASYVNEFIMNYGKNKKADLIVVMADINKMNLLHFFTGPVVQQFVNHSPIPVLSIPIHFNPKAISTVT